MIMEYQGLSNPSIHGHSRFAIAVLLELSGLYVLMITEGKLELCHRALGPGRGRGRSMKQ